MTDARLIGRFHRLAVLGMSFLFSPCNGCGSPVNTEDGGATTDTDADADSDADTDTMSDAGTGAIPCGDDFQLNWEPLPQGIDCGPGCRQIAFETVNTIVGWSASEKYAAFISDENNNAILVDLVHGLSTTINPPQIGAGALSIASVDVNGNILVAAAYSYAGTVGKALVILNIPDGVCAYTLHEEETSGEVTAYSNIRFSSERLSFFQTGKGVSSNKKVKLLNIGNWEQSSIADDLIGRFGLGLSDSFLIWSQGYNDVSGDIWAHRFSTGETWNVTDHPAEQYFPRIDGSRVVWTDNRNGGAQYWDHADIYMRDLETGVTTRVTDGDWIQMHPDISGNRVVFEDYRACSDPNNPYDWAGIDIWMVDISNGEERRLTNYPGFESDPQIVGDKLYYLRQKPEEPNTYAVFEQDLNLLEPQPADAGASYR